MSFFCLSEDMRNFCCKITSSYAKIIDIAFERKIAPVWGKCELILGFESCGYGFVCEICGIHEAYLDDGLAIWTRVRSLVWYVSWNE